MILSGIHGVVADYLVSQVRDPRIDSHQQQKDSWHIWRHLRKDTVFSCNLRCQLIFLHGCFRTYRLGSLRAEPVGRISYNLYFDCKHVRYVTCDLINEYILFTRWSTWHNSTTAVCTHPVLHEIYFSKAVKLFLVPPQSASIQELAANLYHLLHQRWPSIARNCNRDPEIYASKWWRTDQPECSR